MNSRDWCNPVTFLSIGSEVVELVNYPFFLVIFSTTSRLRLVAQKAHLFFPKTVRARILSNGKYGERYFSIYHFTTVARDLLI